VEAAKEKAPKSKKPRPPNKYEKVECKGSGQPQCDALNVWGAAWEAWGQMLLTEIDEMRLAICHLEQQVYYGVPINAGSICDKSGPVVSGPSGPPTDTTQPPKPPFKP
jgi:hypothetical protein